MVWQVSGGPKLIPRDAERRHFLGVVFPVCSSCMQINLITETERTEMNLFFFSNQETRKQGIVIKFFSNQAECDCIEKYPFVF